MALLNSERYAQRNIDRHVAAGKVKLPPRWEREIEDSVQVRAPFVAWLRAVCSCAPPVAWVRAACRCATSVARFTAACRCVLFVACGRGRKAGGPGAGAGVNYLGEMRY